MNHNYAFATITTTDYSIFNIQEKCLGSSSALLLMGFFPSSNAAKGKLSS